eukprot:gene22130-25081_t
MRSVRTVENSSSRVSSTAAPPSRKAKVPSCTRRSPGSMVSSTTFRDAAGNFNADGQEPNNAVALSIGGAAAGPNPDTTPPTVIVSSNKLGLTAGETATISFSLSEASSNFGLSDINVIGGTLSNFQGSGTSTSGLSTPNPADTGPPTVIVSSNKTSLTSGETATISFSLSEPSSNFALSDVTVVGGTLSNFTGSGTGTGTGTGAGTTTPPGDTAPPTVIVSSNKTTLATGETATISFNLSEPSTDFTVGDVLVVGGSLSNFQGNDVDVTLRSGIVPAQPRALSLEFINSGAAGAVFHVYDKLHLERIPRRYTVEAGKSLSDLWTPAPGDQGKYDLWVLGPNGWSAWRGRHRAAAPRQTAPCSAAQAASAVAGAVDTRSPSAKCAGQAHGLPQRSRVAGHEDARQRVGTVPVQVPQSAVVPVRLVFPVRPLDGRV